MKKTVLLCLLLALPACEQDNPLYCQSSADCSGATPFCDVNGEYGDNIKNTCIGDPAAVDGGSDAPVTVDAGLDASADAAWCTTGSCPADQPFCDSTTHTCRTCAAADCNTQAEPVCAPDGLSCVACTADDLGICAATAELCDSSNQCTACTNNTECATAYPALPFCGSNGQCVECTDSSQCGTGGLCAPWTMTCVTPAEMIFVDGDDSAASNSGPCDTSAPCQTIAGGLAKVTTTRQTIAIRPNATSYTELVSVGSGTVNLVGVDGRPTISATGVANGAAISVSGGAKVLVQDLNLEYGARAGVTAEGTGTMLELRVCHLRKNGGDGLQLTGGATARVFDSVVGGGMGAPADRNLGDGIDATSGNLLVYSSDIAHNGGLGMRTSGTVVVTNGISTGGTNWIRNNDLGAFLGSGSITILNTHIYDNGGYGVHVTGGSLTMSGCRVGRSASGGIFVENAGFDIVNNGVFYNGTEATPVGGVSFQATSIPTPARFEHNTLINNAASSVRGVGCSFPAGVLSVRNNVVWDSLASSSAYLVSTAACTWTYSNIGGTNLTAPAGAGNFTADCGWPNDTVGRQANIANIPYSSACVNTADPASSLPTDTYGTARPIGPAYDVGAVEVPLCGDGVCSTHEYDGSTWSNWVCAADCT